MEEGLQGQALGALWVKKESACPMGEGPWEVGMGGSGSKGWVVISGPGADPGARRCLHLWRWW